MKNLVKYLGLITIIVVLIINTYMIKNLSEQNDRIEASISILVRMVNEASNNKSYQSVQSQQKVQKDIMTPLDLADYLGIDMDRVYDMVENKDSKIPYINIDGEYKFSRDAIIEWMKTSGQITTKR